MKDIFLHGAYALKEGGNNSKRDNVFMFYDVRKSKGFWHGRHERAETMVTLQVEMLDAEKYLRVGGIDRCLV